jgi:hypothetical protein
MPCFFRVNLQRVASSASQFGVRVANVSSVRKKDHHEQEPLRTPVSGHYGVDVFVFGLIPVCCHFLAWSEDNDLKRVKRRHLDNKQLYPADTIAGRSLDHRSYGCANL